MRATKGNGGAGLAQWPRLPYPFHLGGVPPTRFTGGGGGIQGRDVGYSWIILHTTRPLHASHLPPNQPHRQRTTEVLQKGQHRKFETKTAKGETLTDVNTHPYKHYTAAPKKKKMEWGGGIVTKAHSSKSRQYIIDSIFLACTFVSFWCSNRYTRPCMTYSYLSARDTCPARQTKQGAGGRQSRSVAEWVRERRHQSLPQQHVE